MKGVHIMPLQEFALDTTRRIQIIRNTDPEDGIFSVLVDNNKIGTISSEEAATTGREFPLTDGSALKVQLVNSHMQVLRNGQPLPLVAVSEQPGAIREPNMVEVTPPVPPKTRSQLKAACVVVFLIGALNFVSGLIMASQAADAASQATVVGVSVVIGVIFLSLGFFVSRRSTVALGIAVTIYSLDALLTLAQGNLFGVMMHIFLLTILFRGFNAIRELRQAELSVQF
jgi:hypothetical protein